jgi:tetratricopeptide (TPR) repeat protein
LTRWDEAAADYKAVLAVAPDDPSAWNNLGNTYLGLTRWADAEECFGKAV